ncbi:MAG: hypothetical protein P4L99_14510 [Chthoniobacter sp.]|nr:hypothetical protein [Chthoniobacter sp.]
MNPRVLVCVWGLLASLVVPPSFFAQAFRTDGGDEKLPWFQLKPGEFPPEGSAHQIAGELIAFDHINRTGVLRQDRTDAISRSHWDEQLPFTMLSFGSISYHGAPAEMRDLPIGTHLHGQFYFEEKAGKDGKGAFTKAIRLEDDFSFFTRLQRTWRVDAIDLEKGTLTVTGVSADGQKADPKPTAFVVNAATRVWKGRSIGALTDLAAGQSVLVNLTVCTLKGPGRCTDIWLDAESRAVASAQQVEVHRQFQREHGLAGWVEAVDNQQGIITMALFAGFDPKLLEDFAVNEPVSSAVSEDSLRTYDQGSDRMKGDVLELQNVPPGPGNSGIRVKFKPVTLLEGNRPRRILRLFSGKWKVDDIPKEERLYQ